MRTKGVKGVPIFRDKGVSVRRNVPLDKDLIIKGAIKELPKDHWCEWCGYGRRLTDRYMCLYTEGACVRIPGSLDKPNPDILHSRIRYDRIYTDAHREVFDDGED